MPVGDENERWEWMQWEVGQLKRAAPMGVVPRALGLQLRFCGGPHRPSSVPETFVVWRGVVARVGRNERAHLRLFDDSRGADEQGVSSSHATLECRDGRLFVRDLSTNGTRINGRLYQRGGAFAAPGSMLIFGASGQ